MKPKKSLGQNFLIDDNVIKKIISSVNATKDDLIIEIGPGRGNLTKELVKITKVLAIEIDKELKLYLNGIQNVEVIYADFLDINLND
jgi:16S rRNA (adenine1518-N6/adenine1519-N6)-dimethyltransferase